MSKRRSRRATLGDGIELGVRGKGRVRLIADRGYDSDPLRKRLALRGIGLTAPHRKNRHKPPTQDGRALRSYKRRVDRGGHLRFPPRRASSPALRGGPHVSSLVHVPSTMLPAAPAVVSDDFRGAVEAFKSLGARNALHIEVTELRDELTPPIEA